MRPDVMTSANWATLGAGASSQYEMARPPPVLSSTSARPRSALISAARPSTTSMASL